MDIGKRIKQLRKEKNLTQEQLAKSINTTKQAIFKYENGVVTNIPMDKLITIAKILGCSPAFLLGWTENTDASKSINISDFDNIFSIATHKIPLLGEIACGEPIFCNEDRDNYVECGTAIKADFCLKAKGDSMIGARIMDGDIVFIRQQDMVENGEIAAVIIADSATLKRVYYYPNEGKLVFQSENPVFAPLVYIGVDLNQIKILGKAIAFQSNVK